MVSLAALAFASAPAFAQDAIDAAALLDERSIGSPDAPVTVAEYFSLTCSHCADFHNDVYGDFKAKYIDTGKVRFVYREFPLDGLALRASMMARCADPQRYAGLLQVLFKSQDDWSRAGDPLAELAKIGRLAGIDKDRFDACMASEELADGILRSRRSGDARGVRGTPTFEINGRIAPGLRTIGQFSQAIDPLLAND